MPRSAPQAGTNEIRAVRLRLRLSQPKFATLLGVSAETYRTWDSGRRLVPDAWLDKAQALAVANDPNRLWSLQELATELGVHVRTLRDAARAGRLDVVYENRVVFRNPIPRATLAAGRLFMERYLQTVVLAIRSKATSARTAQCPLRLESSTSVDPTRTPANADTLGRTDRCSRQSGRLSVGI